MLLFVLGLRGGCYSRVSCRVDGFYRPIPNLNGRGVMRKVSSVFLLCTTLFAGMTSQAQAALNEQSLRAFALCDGSFFKRLKVDLANNTQAIPVATKGDISWIKVPDRKKHNTVVFKTPITMTGLQLVSYFDENLSMKDFGQFYYWGFNVNGDIDDVVKQFKTLTKDGARIVADGDAFARLDVNIGGQGWKPVNPVSGTIPGKGRAERILLFEKHEHQAGVVRVSCSLQGDIAAEMLRTIRPDI